MSFFASVWRTVSRHQPRGMLFNKNPHLMKPMLPVSQSFASGSDPSYGSEKNKIDDGTNNKKLSLMQRFKNTYAIYGKVTLVVHGITSCFWCAGVYGLASSGINLLELLETLQAPESMCRPLRMGSGSVNTLATALVLYKIISPLRYGSTLFLTRYTVKYLRMKGKAPQPTEEDRLRNLAKESAQISRERVRAGLARRRKSRATRSKRSSV